MPRIWRGVLDAYDYQKQKDQTPISVDLRKEKENYKGQPCDKCHSQNHSAARFNILCIAY